MWSVNGPLSCPGWVHRRGEVGPSPASKNRGSQEALSMQDTARKGREPAGGSRKGRKRRGPLRSQREKRRFFFFFDTSYVLATELVSILNCQGKRLESSWFIPQGEFIGLRGWKQSLPYVYLDWETQVVSAGYLSLPRLPDLFFSVLAHQILTPCSSGLFYQLRSPSSGADNSPLSPSLGLGHFRFSCIHA